MYTLTHEDYSLVKSSLEAYIASGEKYKYQVDASRLGIPAWALDCIEPYEGEEFFAFYGGEGYFSGSKYQSISVSLGYAHWSTKHNANVACVQVLISAKSGKQIAGKSEIVESIKLKTIYRTAEELVKLLELEPEALPIIEAWMEDNAPRPLPNDGSGAESSDCKKDYWLRPGDDAIVSFKLRVNKNPSTNEVSRRNWLGLTDWGFLGFSLGGVQDDSNTKVAQALLAQYQARKAAAAGATQPKVPLVGI